MQFLKFLEGIRNPVCDFFFSLITHLGEETFFIVCAVLIFWCISKKGGYFVLITGFISTIFNQELKLIFRVDRPFVIDPSLTIVEAAREEAKGFSFPSGHTQSITATLGAIALYFKGKTVKIVAAVIIALVAFSRMYLGVHTPQDVVVSLFIAGVLLVVLYPFFFDDLRFKRRMPWIVLICAVLAITFVVFTQLLPRELFTTEAELANLESGIKNSANLLGCMLGMVLVFPLDYFVIKFDTKASWYGQVLKVILGFAILLLIKEGLRTPLEMFFGLFTEDPMFIARTVRYFIIVAFSGAVWPLTFKWFSQLKIGALDKFGEKVAQLFKGNEKTEA